MARHVARTTAQDPRRADVQRLEDCEQAAYQALLEASRIRPDPRRPVQRLCLEAGRLRRHPPDRPRGVVPARRARRLPRCGRVGAGQKRSVQRRRRRRAGAAPGAVPRARLPRASSRTPASKAQGASGGRHRARPGVPGARHRAPRLRNHHGPWRRSMRINRLVLGLSLLSCTTAFAQSRRRRRCGRGRTAGRHRSRTAGRRARQLARPVRGGLRALIRNCRAACSNRSPTCRAAGSCSTACAHPMPSTAPAVGVMGLYQGDG